MIQDFAQALDLPNFFTGYAYLLDQDHRIRWKGCGLAKPHEIEHLIQCAEQLVSEIKADVRP